MTKIDTLFALSIVLISLASCEKRPQGTPTQATMDLKEAKSAAKEIPYRAELERGLVLQFNYVNIPHGNLQIMSGLSSRWRARI